MNLERAQIGKALRDGMVVLGAWSLYAQLAILARLDFATLKAFSFLPLLGAVLYLLSAQIRLTRLTRLSPAVATLAEKDGARFLVPRWYWVLAPAAISLLYGFTRSAWLFWVLTLAYLVAMQRTASSSSAPSRAPEAKIARWELMGVVFLAIMAVLVTSGASRPDRDDAQYVSLAVASMDSPSEPLLGFDSLYRSGLPVVEQTLHFVQTYELMIGVLAEITRLPVPLLYYVILPALWAVISVVAHWLLLRRFLPAGPAMVALASLVALLILWGDGHRAFGNFAFVRLFQGKAVFLLVGLPLLVHAALEFRGAPSVRSGFALLLHQCAATGFTTNGLVLAPVAVALVLLAAPQTSPRYWRMVAGGLSTAIPLAVLGIGMLGHVSSISDSLGVDPFLFGFRVVLGPNRTAVVLLSLLLLPWLVMTAKLRGSNWVSGYVLLVFLLVFCPATARILSSNLSPVFGWRIFWAVPIPLLVGMTCGLLAGTGTLLPRRGLRLAFLFLLLMAFTFAGPTAVTQTEWALSNIGAYKVDHRLYDIAKRISSVASREGPVLVEEDVAVYLCGLHDAPSLVAVRADYLKKLRGTIPGREFNERMSLLRYIGNEEGTLQMSDALKRIEALRVATVGFSVEHPDAERLRNNLSGRDFNVFEYSGYFVAVRSIP